MNGEVSASGVASPVCQLRGDGTRQQSQRAVASSRHDIGICRAGQRSLVQAAVALKAEDTTDYCYLISLSFAPPWRK